MMLCQNREEWLRAAVAEISVEIFDPAGYSLPKVRIGVGWPIGNRDQVRGQCFSQESSEDGTYEIFISPSQDNPHTILAILVHELGHAIAGIAAAHKKPFIEVMRAVGVTKPWKSVTLSPELDEVLDLVSGRLGKYPHAALTILKKPGKKGSRLLKVACEECGYTVRVTRKWIDAAGPPFCPTHGIAFVETDPKE